MRTTIMVVVSIIILVGFNYNINRVQQVKREGNAIYLKLRPVDPRSLIQGDYMWLSYSIEQDASEQLGLNQSINGDIVVGVDSDDVAYFIRVYHGEALAPGEQLIPFRAKYGSAHLIFDRYYIQESQDKKYDSAAFGVIKCLEGNRCLLVGLAGKDKNSL